MYHCVTNRLVPAGIYLLKVNNRNTRARCEICSKLTIKTPDHHLVFLLLILNNFHTLFLCFYCQLWTCNCRLGCLYLCIGFHIEYNSSSTGILNFICSCFPAGNGMFKINNRNTRTQWNVYIIIVITQTYQTKNITITCSYFIFPVPLKKEKKLK